MGFFTRLFANVSGGKDIQPELVSRATRDRVIVHVRFLTEEQMHEAHPNLVGSERGPMLLGDGEYHAYIDCVQPDDFNDFNRIETLGHEFWHALGATHKES